MTLRFVSATRASAPEFQERAPLASSLARWEHHPLFGGLTLFANNSTPLGHLYNQILDEEFARPSEQRNQIVLVHDDVLIEDLFCLEKLDRNLGALDVVGLAGSTHFSIHEEPCKWIQEPFRNGWSGLVWHPDSRRAGQTSPWMFGPHREVVVLDGLFLGLDTRRGALARCRFDAGLGFHFYDLDFCLSAAQAGARLGTDRIHAVHLSSGNYESEAFQRDQAAFRKKWSAVPGTGVFQVRAK